MSRGGWQDAAEEVIRLRQRVVELEARLSEVIIGPDDPGVEGFSDEVVPGGNIIRGSHALRNIVLHILKDWEQCADNETRLASRVKELEAQNKEWLRANAPGGRQNPALGKVSDLKKLPIVFRGKSEDYADEGEIPIVIFRESDYLTLMDRAEQKPAWNLGAVGGQSSDCVPPPKKSRAVETSENPFQGPHWQVDVRNLGSPIRILGILDDRTKDLARELLRMRGEK